MKVKQLVGAAAVAFIAASAFAQEATPDTWTHVPAAKSVAQVRAELAQARKDGTIKSTSAGYIEKLPAVKSREQVREEVAAARASGELSRIGGEAHGFTAPNVAPPTRMAGNR